MGISLHWRRLRYRIRHQYWSFNALVVVLAIVVAVAWTWGSITMMQRNYQLQRRLDAKQRERQLVQLQVDTLAYEQKYYRSAEYQELAARSRLGLANPGEKLLVLPPNSQKAKEFDAQTQPAAASDAPGPSNLRQWLDFLSGKNVRDLQNIE
ncbi:hypothetical protein CR983_00700 [Candidatus Saccharibacteria bacterium]|nr:MAG: hypothetical protein CR983_00700 [Candidatus Saccharibacteria bacterium]